MQTVSAATPSAAHPTRAALWPLFVLALTLANAAALRTVFSPLQEIVGQDLGLNDQQLGMIQGVAASIPIALLSFPVGRITDRGNRLRLLIALAVAWCAGSLWTVVANDFVSLFMARLLAAAGSGCALIVAISLAADYAPPHQRGRALFGVQFGMMLGGAVAFALGGAALGVFAAPGAGLFGLSPWRSVHLAFGIAGIVMALALLAIREPARAEVEAQAASLRTALREIWARRGLIGPLFLGQITVVMADAAAQIWAAPVLTRSYGQTPEQFSGWIGLALLASGLIGATAGAFAADFGHKSRIAGGVLLGAVIASLIGIPAALFPLMPTVLGFGLLLTLLLTCGAVTGLVSAATVAILIPNDIRGVVLAAFFVISGVIGLGVAPVLVTVISEAMGGGMALRYGLTIIGVVSSTAAAIGFVGAMGSAIRTEKQVG